MVQIRRKKGGYTQRHNGVETHIPGGEVLYEDNSDSFRGLNLTGMHVDYADLSGYDLRDADFTRAWLTASTMRKTLLAGTRFSHADLVGCDLTGAILGDADFTGASLVFASLSDCDMTSAVFEGAHLEFCRYNASTIWPAGVDPAAIGAKLRED